MARKNRPSADVALWIIQVLLALLFLAAGGAKLVMPAARLHGPVALPVGFLRFIGFAELAGAFGLTLPGALHIKEWLTPLAACGLLVIMIGATVLSLVGLGPGAAAIPLLVGVLVGLVAWARRPHDARQKERDGPALPRRI